eukprot:8248151-Alexandrium_andersonii.AAC.1
MAAARHSSGSSESRAATTATSSASRCAAAVGRATWTRASTRAGRPAFGSGAGGGRCAHRG